MRRLWFSFLAIQRVLIVLALLCLGGGCTTTSDTVGLIASGTALGAHSPAHEIEQIYYLGVFDPMEQTPSAIFRLTVRGQASLLSWMRFASGWAPASLVDSLNTNLTFTDQGVVAASKEETAALSQIQTGRRLILFGPEGYREAPRNHRLVLVMSSSPEKYFSALGEALGTIADVQVQKLDARFHEELLRCLAKVRDEQKRIEAVRDDVRRDITAKKGVH
jgi:hypothetical protein